MKYFCIILLAVIVGEANAATITNSDAKERVITITKSGVRTEHRISPNASVELCEKGCFALFPSGDMLPLKGDEKVVIQNGSARISLN